MAKEISAEIRGYIKTRFKLGFSARAIFNEICSAYGHGTTSYATVTRWISGIEAVDSASGRGRPASVVTSKMTDKVNDLLKIDARMTTRQVARSLSISADQHLRF